VRAVSLQGARRRAARYVKSCRERGGRARTCRRRGGKAHGLQRHAVLVGHCAPPRARSSDEGQGRATRHRATPVRGPRHGRREGKGAGGAGARTKAAAKVVAARVRAWPARRSLVSAAGCRRAARAPGRAGAAAAPHQCTRQQPHLGSSLDRSVGHSRISSPMSAGDAAREQVQCIGAHLRLASEGRFAKHIPRPASKQQLTSQQEHQLLPPLPRAVIAGHRGHTKRTWRIDSEGCQSGVLRVKLRPGCAEQQAPAPARPARPGGGPAGR